MKFAKNLKIIIPIVNIAIFGCFFAPPDFFEGVLAETEPVYFFVDPDYDLLQRPEIIATLRETSEYGYFFTDNQWLGTLKAADRVAALKNIDSLAKEFDNVIYPKLTKFFGDIWLPGIDNDPKITVLLLPLKGEVGGYINYSDEYSKDDFPTSNEREMFYLNTSHLDKPLAKSFLAHEFQHLITFYQKDKLRGIPEDIWLNEARSEYAPTYLGYDDIFNESNLKRRVKAFLEEPSNPLCEFENKLADYGVISLFFQYLADHYGKEIISEMLKDEKVGIESLNNAFKKRGYDNSFSEVFTNWTIANLLNNCSYDKLFCYLAPNLNYNNLHIDLGETVGTASLAEKKTIKDWQPLYYKFEPAENLAQKILKINFEKENPEDLFKIPYIINNSDGTISVNFMEISDNKAVVYISDFGEKVSSLILIITKQSKFSNFDSSNPSVPFKLSATLAEELPDILKQERGLLRARGDYKVYLIEDGKKHWIPSPKIFELYNLDWESIKVVDAKELENFPRAKLFRAKGDNKVYYLTESGLIRHIPSVGAFLSYGNRWEDIIELNPEELKIYQENELIYLVGAHKVYKLENGKKRWIKTAEVFEKMGYDWSKIAPINLTEFGVYPEGPPII
ncbi:MAG: hypothetical protein COV69_02330 [Parcubacteria group bacterium CG11_big_fil_rev_8_21_14_0_20_39_14]|nr:MAG: hypothetical protein COV69_02330 [Parcubacteria group bacterium CG11_big_fil_rev_8_21_14_0_20_39_14]PIS35419.1 MAG: hypothetical protein COT36_02485 [Parcubacteria group bacterium CG08_land_8_20_14_0_20_38_56]